jgi:hypothetical protein
VPATAKPLPWDTQYRFTGFNKFLDIDGYPAVAPPWGTLNAINMNTGEYAWKIPLGEYPELAAQGLNATGTENYGGPIVTAGGLVFIGATSFDKKLRAFDKDTGKLLWEALMVNSGNATPITYEVNGKQFVVIAAFGGYDAARPNAVKSAPPGGAFVAFALVGRYCPTVLGGSARGLTSAERESTSQQNGFLHQSSVGPGRSGIESPSLPAPMNTVAARGEDCSRSNPRHPLRPASIVRSSNRFRADDDACLRMDHHNPQTVRSKPSSSTGARLPLIVPPTRFGGPHRRRRSNDLVDLRIKWCSASVTINAPYMLSFVCVARACEVVNERAGARRRELGDERIVGLNGGHQMARHPAPSGNTIGITLDLHSVPVDGSLTLEMVYNGDPRGPPSFEKECWTWQRHRISRGLRALLQHESHRGSPSDPVR